MVFLNFAVRKVELKELWMLKWHQQFNTTRAWTKSGGAGDENWQE